MPDSRERRAAPGPLIRQKVRTERKEGRDAAAGRTCRAGRVLLRASDSDDSADVRPDSGQAHQLGRAAVTRGSLCFDPAGLGAVEVVHRVGSEVTPVVAAWPSGLGRLAHRHAPADLDMVPAHLRYEEGLWGSRSRPKPLTCSDRQHLHDRHRVATAALPDLQPATELADTAPPRTVIQGHRATRPTP
jgi:hypothetical protein